jgi:hypothetical protein
MGPGPTFRIRKERRLRKMSHDREMDQIGYERGVVLAFESIAPASLTVEMVFAFART